MPRYFFHLRDGTGEIKDDEGQEFASLSDAEAHARLVHNELTCHTTPGEIKGRLVVTDAQGNDVLEILLSDVPSLQPKRPSPLH